MDRQIVVDGVDTSGNLGQQGHRLICDNIACDLKSSAASDHKPLDEQPGHNAEVLHVPP